MRTAATIFALLIVAGLILGSVVPGVFGSVLRSFFWVGVAGLISLIAAAIDFWLHRDGKWLDGLDL